MDLPPPRSRQQHADDAATELVLGHEITARTVSSGDPVHLSGFNTAHRPSGSPANPSVVSARSRAFRWVAFALPSAALVVLPVVFLGEVAAWVALVVALALPPALLLGWFALGVLRATRSRHHD